MRTGPGGPEILGTPEGTDVLGGADIDEAILSYVDDAVGGALARLDLDDARTAVALARLRQDCVLAKETLSLDTEAVVPVFLPGRHFEIRLNRTTFEQMLRAPLESTLDALSHAVRSAGLAPADVDAVLLVGGSTRIPMVAQMVAREFGRPLLEGVHPVHAVALGAAALAAAPAVPAGYGAVPMNRTAAGPWAALAPPRRAPPQPSTGRRCPFGPREPTRVTRDLPMRPPSSTSPTSRPSSCELPRLEPAPDAQPAAWPVPAGPQSLPTAAVRALRPALAPAAGSRREAGRPEPRSRRHGRRCGPGGAGPRARVRARSVGGPPDSGQRSRPRRRDR